MVNIFETKDFSYDILAYVDILSDKEMDDSIDFEKRNKT